MNSIPDLSSYRQQLSVQVFGAPSETILPDPDPRLATSEPIEAAAEQENKEPALPEDPGAALIFNLDDQRHLVPLADLVGTNFFTDQLPVFQQAVHPILFIVQDLFNWPDETRFLFFTVLKELGTQTRMQLDADAKDYASPFEGILAHLVGSEDLMRCSRGQRAAIEAAGLFLTADIWPIAAAEISRKLKDLGIRGILPQSILKSIHKLADKQVKVDKSDPTELAREFLQQHRQKVLQERETAVAGFAEKTEDLSQDDLPASENDPILDTTPILRYFQEEYYVWQGKCWEKVNTKEFESGVTQFLQMQADITVTKPLIANVLANLQGLCRLPGWFRSLPFWIEAENPLTIGRPRLINLANGMINLDEVLENKVLKPYPHDPRHFSTVELPYAYDPAASCPLWEQTLAEIFPPLDVAENDQRIQVIQEFMGWSLFANDMQFEAFMILLGKGANGKSTLARVWEAFLGAANVSHVPLEGLANEFRPYDMAGKLANIAGDMQRMERVEEGILKQLISGDSLQTNRKNKDPVTMIPTAKLIFATNELPPINDRSDGVWRRMIAVPFLVQFPLEKRDTHRAANLLKELPGIFNWALTGARRLYHQGRFTVCPICTACVEEHRVHSDPFQQFIQEETTLHPNASINTKTLYEAYVRFCEGNGRKARNSSEFGKQVCGLSGVTKDRQSSGSRGYEYRGIACRHPLFSSVYSVISPIHDITFTTEILNPSVAVQGRPSKNLSLGRP